MNSTKFDLENLIQGFKLACQTEGKSPKTIEWYNGFLERFLRFLDMSGYPSDINQINRDHIRAFIRYLQTEARTPHVGKILSAATIQGYCRTLKAFFSWLKREEYIRSNPMDWIPIPRAPMKILNTFNYEQIGKLITLCQQSNGNGYRNMTILMLLLDTGLRVSELVNIELSDVNLIEGNIKIRQGKGGRERLVPVPCPRKGYHFLC